MEFELSLCNRNPADGTENELETSLATELVGAYHFVPVTGVFGYCKVRRLQNTIEQPRARICEMSAMKLSR